MPVGGSRSLIGMSARVVPLMIVVLAASCVSEIRPVGEPVPVLSIDTDGFIGFVREVSLGDGYAVNRDALPWLVGPMTLMLEDGHVLDVPAATPGEIGCIDLMRHEDWEFLTGFENPDVDAVTGEQAYRPCAVLGDLDEHGSVSWFAVLDASEGQRTIRFRAMDSIEGDRVLIPFLRRQWQGYLAFAFDRAAANIHPSDGSCPKTVAALPDSDFADLHNLFVDPATGTVVGYECEYVG